MALSVTAPAAGTGPSTGVSGGSLPPYPSLPGSESSSFKQEDGSAADAKLGERNLGSAGAITARTSASGIPPAPADGKAWWWHDDETWKTYSPGSKPPQLKSRGIQGRQNIIDDLVEFIGSLFKKKEKNVPEGEVLDRRGKGVESSNREFKDHVKEILDIMQIPHQEGEVDTLDNALNNRRLKRRDGNDFNNGGNEVYGRPRYPRARPLPVDDDDFRNEGRDVDSGRPRPRTADEHDISDDDDFSDEEQDEFRNKNKDDFRTQEGELDSSHPHPDSGVDDDYFNIRQRNAQQIGNNVDNHDNVWGGGGPVKRQHFHWWKGPRLGRRGMKENQQTDGDKAFVTRSISQGINGTSVVLEKGSNEACSFFLLMPILLVMALTFAAIKYKRSRAKRSYAVLVPNTREKQYTEMAEAMA